MVSQAHRGIVKFNVTSRYVISEIVGASLYCLWLLYFIITSLNYDSFKHNPLLLIKSNKPALLLLLWGGGYLIISFVEYLYLCII